MFLFQNFFNVKNEKKVIRIVRRKKPRGAKEYHLKKEAARALVVELLEKVNKTYGFEYGRVAIRNQKTRWGSCSSQGNLNFNYRVVDLPLRLAEYIVVHELCHLKEMNHGKSFWDLVAIAMPDYKEARRELKETKMK